MSAAGRRVVAGAAVADRVEDAVDLGQCGAHTKVKYQAVCQTIVGDIHTHTHWQRGVDKDLIASNIFARTKVDGYGARTESARSQTGRGRQINVGNGCATGE